MDSTAICSLHVGTYDIGAELCVYVGGGGGGGRGAGGGQI